MSILQITTDFAGQIGVEPRIVRIKTTNTQEEIMENNFLQGAIQNGFQFQPTDLAAVVFADNSTEIFKINISSTGIVLVPSTDLSTLFSFQSFMGGEDIFLTNPVATMNYVNFVMPVLQVHLPPMNQSNSRQVGEKIVFKNTDNLETLTIADNAGNILALGVKPGGYIVLTVIDTSTAEGAFDVELPLDAANNLSEVLVTGTHVTEWHGVWAAPVSGNITYTVLGESVRLTFPNVLANGDSSSDIITMDTALPAFLRPPGAVPLRYLIAVQTDGGSNQAVGLLLVQPSGAITVGASVANADFAGSTNALGFHHNEASYDLI
jgi:hypothetical protein